ncbi:MAG: metal-sulfur cluster assembly factor [Anaerolineales bacterium]|nr:metal-sulfur cluster assembly factor [Anaerolineales bacterium]
MTEAQIRQALQQVIDPEIGISIVDLGLIYQITIEPEQVTIRLTMTSPACPLHGVITRDIDRVLRQTFPDLGAMTIELVWEPPWSPERLSPTARKMLGW